MCGLVAHAECNASGECNAFVVWWSLEMCAGVHLSCAPRWAAARTPTPSSSSAGVAGDGEYQWREHWLQAVYYPSRALAVRRGQQLRLDAFHDEFSLWFDWAAAAAAVSCERSTSPPVKKQIRTDSEIDRQEAEELRALIDRTRPLCTCGFHTAFPRRRVAQLNRSETLYQPLVDEAAKVTYENDLFLCMKCTT